MPSRKPSYDDPYFEGGATPPESIVFDSKMLTNWMQAFSQNWRLGWQLFTSRQVPTWTKLIPILSVLYWLSPFDFALIPIIGFTPVDDMVVLYLGARLFVELCPKPLVSQMWDEIKYGSSPNDFGEIIDTTYQILDDD